MVAQIDQALAARDETARVCRQRVVWGRLLWGRDKPISLKTSGRVRSVMELQRDLTPSVECRKRDLKYTCHGRTGPCFCILLADRHAEVDASHQN